jgi:hypothetical protein
LPFNEDSENKMVDAYYQRIVKNFLVAQEKLKINLSLFRSKSEMF